MQNQSKDWLLAASITLGVGVAAAIVVPSGKLGSALLGSTTGAIIGATVLNGRQAEKNKNETIVEQLRQEQINLAKISGKLTQRQEEYRALQDANANLTQQRQELEERVATINQHNPNLKTREQLQAQIEELSLKSSSLEGKMKALGSEVKQLESQKRALVDVEAKLSVRQAEFTQLVTQVQALEAKSQQFAQKSAELELLRATYDGLFSERQNLESSIKELNPELAKLEAEKHLLQGANANLTQQRQELEERVATINQHNPNLKTREQLQAQIEELSLKSSSLEGKMKALGSEVEQLESQKRALVDVEAQLSVRQAEFTQLATQVQALEAKSQEFAQKSAELELLRATYDGLFSERQNLESSIKELNPELAKLQAEKHLLQGANANLTQQRQELEERVATINQHNPNLKTREQLQAQIEELSLKSSSLEGKMKAFGSEVEQLESQKRALVDVEAQLAVRQAEFTQLATQVQALEAKSQEFAQKSAELELLRATYDGLFSERQSLENRIKELNPELARLQAEKQQIEQGIETQAVEYANSLRLQQEINELRHTIGRLKRQQREQEAENNRLKDEETHLNQRIRELQEQIRNIESKIGDRNLRLESALEALKQSPWRESKLPISKWSASLDEQAFIKDFISYLKDRGLDFPERVIRAFHTSFKVQGISAIVVLAGISGTGKSELPQLYAKYVGALPLVLAVQPRWDSPQDLLGFYNYMEDKFKPTPLIQGIYQYNHEAKLREQDRMVIVLLDEMNLARVEYYFSEFLSKLEARRNHDAYLDIDLGSLPVPDKYRRYKVPEQFLFVGTMNEDETTQTLSDKVLDRANVLTFGKPAQLQIGRNGSTSTEPSGYLTYSQFKKWIKSPDPSFPVVQKVTEILTQANEVMEAMGHPFAHRVYQSITQYVVNYPGVEDEKSEFFKAALADQFGQKLLPKLRGIMTEDEQIKTNLKQLAEIIAGIGDDALETAFTRACQGYQFQWKGLVYQDSQKNDRGN